MLLLAALLSFGWPKLELEFGPGRALRGGEWALRVNSCCGSMRPQLQAGQIVYVRKWDGREPLLGRVVSTKTSLHQVVAENKRAVKTAGIANAHSDPWSPKSEILYVVVYAVRP